MLHLSEQGRDEALRDARGTLPHPCHGAPTFLKLLQPPLSRELVQVLPVGSVVLKLAGLCFWDLRTLTREFHQTVAVLTTDQRWTSYRGSSGSAEGVSLSYSLYNSSAILYCTHA